MLTLTAPTNTRAATTMDISKVTRTSTIMINTMTKVHLLPASSLTMGMVSMDHGQEDVVTIPRKTPRPSVTLP